MRSESKIFSSPLVAGAYTGSCQKHLAVTVVPRVQPLVEFGRRLRIHAGHARRAGHQLRVQQPPTQPRRQIVRKLRSVRAVLALHGDDPDRRMHHDPE